MNDRHDKWQRVEPGHVIPAGQPYRVENDPDSPHIWEEVSQYDRHIPGDFSVEWFVDSSWKPPLVLPDTPTWGVPIAYGCTQPMSQWYETIDGRFRSLDGSELGTENVLDFIPLTDEQVARIEAAR